MASTTATGLDKNTDAAGYRRVWENMPVKIRQMLPAILCSFIFLGFITDTVIYSMSLNDDHLVYGLDDAYIHMSIARNFVERGVWGVTPYAFSSTTSSPLWTILVAFAYAFTSVNNVAPLVINIFVGILLLFAANDFLARFQVPLLYRLVILITLVLFIPFNTLVLSGMEHLLQILINVLFLDYAVRQLSTSELSPSRSWPYWRLPLLAAAVTTVRYEGILLVFAVCVLLLARRKIRYAFLVGGFALMPIIVYGLIAMAHGWPFVPASLSVKSSTLSYLTDATWEARFTFLITDTYNIFANQHVLSLPVLTALALCLFLYEKNRRLWDDGIILLVIFIFTTLMSVRLVSWPDAGTFSRYEAYLIAFALLVIPAAIGRWLPRQISFKALPVVAFGVLLITFLMNDIYTRYTRVANETPVVTATTEIYRQQYQMGRFLAAYYNDATVATNDIGAVNYFSDINNVDLWGLGTVEVARAKATNSYTSAVMDQIAEEAGVKLAIVYDEWLDLYGGVPDDWILVERWQYERAAVILGNRVVSFYALNESDVEQLQSKLDEFAPMLPNDISRLAGS